MCLKKPILDGKVSNFSGPTNFNRVSTKNLLLGANILKNQRSRGTFNQRYGTSVTSFIDPPLQNVLVCIYVLLSHFTKSLKRFVDFCAFKEVTVLCE